MTDSDFKILTHSSISWTKIAKKDLFQYFLLDYSYSWHVFSWQWQWEVHLSRLDGSTSWLDVPWRLNFHSLEQTRSQSQDYKWYHWNQSAWVTCDLSQSRAGQQGRFQDRGSCQVWLVSSTTFTTWVPDFQFYSGHLLSYSIRRTEFLHFKLFFSSDSGYICLVFHNRDQHIIEMHYGEFDSEFFGTWIHL